MFSSVSVSILMLAVVQLCKAAPSTIAKQDNAPAGFGAPAMPMSAFGGTSQPLTSSQTTSGFGAPMMQMSSSGQTSQPSTSSQTASGFGAPAMMMSSSFRESSSSSSQPLMPQAASEDKLYSNIDFNSFSQGYGDDKGGKRERIDEGVQQLPTIEEQQQGQDQTFDHALPDLNKFNRVDNTKEIHTYTDQKKIVTVNNRNLHRYLKNLNVNTQYNTNIEKIAHSKLNNLLINNLQETHQPKLLVKYSRTDTTQDLGVRNEAPIVENERKDNRLPDVFVPAVAERIGYNGQPLPVKTEVVADESGSLPSLRLN